MKPYKWRAILSVANLVLALALSAIGLREYRLFRQTNPGAFHEVNLAYLPSAQLVMYSVDAPAFVVNNLIGRGLARTRLWECEWIRGSWFFRVSRSFYLLVFLFWWLVGWTIDSQVRAGISRQGIGIPGDVAGVLLSLGLLYVGFEFLYRYDYPSAVIPGQRVLPIATLVWGAVLLFYFGRRLIAAVGERKAI